jgi:sulfotransferase family protein
MTTPPCDVRLPTFLHIGPGKTGSTWLHEVLSLHPEVYLSPAKDLYFFSRYYDRGVDWYRSLFAQAPGDVPVVGEICPDYLLAPAAPARIREVLGPDVKLMVTLRDPIDRAFSSYLYAAKHGLAQPTFRATITAQPEMVQEGRYATQLRPYVDAVGAEQIRVGVFDDFEADPQSFLDATTDWLGVGRLPLTPEQLEAQLPASKARFLPLAKIAKLGANWVRNHDGANVVGRVKRAPVIQRLLYAPLGDERPEIEPDDRDYLRETFDPEVRAVEEQFGVPLRRRWGWTG